ncbi:ATP-dependent RNA helicase, putative [Pyrococcus sp. NA2]|uniref:CRISPR-associated helicase Cas3' n=1 Tax=Pyrococcus sp. (strain NA2) TaxID=342949 RepID=UPI000209AC0F|nr:CRISPR-associated helicase Cas3' [Pyrococcus sp. NA2]AEC52733.1 ATP-dependent RNA helicase, putative [Pyrococcus sp. NA2]
MDIKEFFKRLTGFEPYDYQVRAWEAIQQIMETGGKVVIEVPTAGGKTEAAIIPFLFGVYNNTWPVARLIYVLPTRSLVEKQAERIKKLIYEALKLRGMSEKEAKDYAEKVVVVEYGLERTHAFLGWVIVTTWDSFLYGLAAHRTVGNRFTFPAGAIAESLVVFDEVHMYQDESMYMPRLLSLVVDILAKANVPVVIMSATLPSKLRDMIAKNAKTINVDPSDEHKPSRGEVDVEIIEGDVVNVLEEIKRVLNEGKKVLVVHNTVSRAIETYEFLKEELKNELEDPDILLIHSRFTLEDRKKKEKAIESARLIVSTQVIEAGLDLPNVGLVVTDIAPLDAIIQRIGRCARRTGERGKGIILLPIIKKDDISSMRIVRGLSELKKTVGGDIESATLNSGDRVVEVVCKVGSKTQSVYVSDITGIKERSGKKGAKSPKDIYVLPYSSLPYDPLILLTTYDELVYSKNIRDYLEDAEKARNALDRVYKFHYENNIVPREFASAYIYFKELKLFSAPPEYELRSRPELYVMLYLTDSKEINELDTNKIIRITYRNSKEWKEEDIIVGKLEPQWDKEGKRILKWKVQKTFRINPYEIYVLNPKYYDPEIGFVPESKEKYKNKQKASKSSNRESKTKQVTLTELGVIR